MKKLIIFGTGKIADIIFYYATEECGFEVSGFTVDSNFVTNETFHGLPVVAFETVKTKFPPDEFSMFIALGYHSLNKVRQIKYESAKEKGYQLESIISPYSHLPKNIVIGDNCFIMPPSLIHPYVEIENNVFVWNGSVIGHHSKINSHTWVTSGVNIAGNVTIGQNTFLAINATIGHNVSISENCFIGSNTLITKNIDANTVVIENSTKPFRLNSQQFLKMNNFL